MSICVSTRHSCKPLISTKRSVVCYLPSINSWVNIVARCQLDIIAISRWTMNMLINNLQLVDQNSGPVFVVCRPKCPRLCTDMVVCNDVYWLTTSYCSVKICAIKSRKCEKYGTEREKLRYGFCCINSKEIIKSKYTECLANFRILTFENVGTPKAKMQTRWRRYYVLVFPNKLMMMMMMMMMHEVMMIV